MVVYHCDKCDKKFDYKSNLNRHIKDKHNDELSTQSGSTENSDIDIEEEIGFGNGDMDIDSDDEKDENYEAWILLNNFIIEPEINLLDKYILFRKLLIKAYDDSTFKRTLKAIQHFKDKLGFHFIITTRCTIRFLEPMIDDILNEELKDDFWEYFLELPINENTTDNVAKDYLKIVIDKYENLFELTSLMESDILNKKIVKRKNKFVRKYNSNEIDGFTNAVKREVTQFKAIEEYINNPDRDIDESE